MANQPQLPTFTLEVKGDMSANWEHFLETFEAYATLMGYRDTDDKGNRIGSKEKELAALQFALPKEARTVLKNSVTWGKGEDKKDPASNLKKLGEYYVGTKNVIHERVEFNRMMHMDSEPMNHWETRCREQSAKCEYCQNCAPELTRDRFIVGINDDTLLTKLVNEAVKKPDITFETIVLHARQYEATKDKVKTMTATSCDEQVNFTRSTQSKKPIPAKPTVRQVGSVKLCAWCAEPQHQNGLSECKAQGKQCYSCGRMNHIGKACLHPDPKWRTKRPDSVQDDGSKRVPASKGSRHQVHQMEDDDGSDDQYADKFQYSNFSIELEQSAHAVGSSGSKGLKYFADLHLAGMGCDEFTKVSFQIDSAATCNTIPFSTLRQVTDPHHSEYGIQPSNS